jgi:hypothetical protein
MYEHVWLPIKKPNFHNHIFKRGKHNFFSYCQIFKMMGQMGPKHRVAFVNIKIRDDLVGYQYIYIYIYIVT